MTVLFVSILLCHRTTTEENSQVFVSFRAAFILVSEMYITTSLPCTALLLRINMSI